MPHEQTSQSLVKDFLPEWNFLDNSNFDLWRRALSQTINGYGSSDRWGHGIVGNSHVVSKQPFTVGELFPDGTPTPDYYCRKVLTSVAAAGNYNIMYQRVPYLPLLQGKKITLSFYAKSSVEKNIGIEIVYNYGTGGSPTAATTGIGARAITLTTSWKKYTIVISLPVVASNVVFGTTRYGDVSIVFWQDAGSTYASRASSVGQSSATIDMTAITMMIGAHSSVTAPIPKTLIQETHNCARFYTEIDFTLSKHNTSVGGNGGFGAGLYIYEMAHTFFHLSPTATYYTNRNKTSPKVTLGTTVLTEVTPSTYMLQSAWPDSVLIYPALALTNIGDYLYGTLCLDFDW